MKKLFFLATLLVVLCLTFPVAILAEDQQSNSTPTNIAEKKVLPNHFLLGKWDCPWRGAKGIFWSTFDITQSDDPTKLKIIYNFRGLVVPVVSLACDNDGNHIRINLPKGSVIDLNVEGDEIKANYTIPGLESYSSKLIRPK